MATGDAATEGSAFSDEMGLPDEFLEVARTHAGGEGLPLRRWMEERLGLGAGRATGGGHARMVARRAPGPAGQMAAVPVRCVRMKRLLTRMAG